MHPVLFRLTHPLTEQPLEIHSYGVLIVLGFIAGIIVVRALARTRRLAHDRREILPLTGLIIVGALVGAKFFDILFALPSYLENFSFPESLTGSGLMFYGGVIGALGVFVLYCRSRGMETLSWLDLFAPGLALGQAFGRLGCFLAGCCYGAPTSCAFGVVFEHPDNHVTPLGIPLHPTQLYEASFALVLCLVLVFLFRRRRPRTPGGLMAIYLASYAVFRFAIEFLRADPRGELLFGLLTASQAVSLGMLALAASIFLRRRRSFRQP